MAPVPYAQLSNPEKEICEQIAANRGWTPEQAWDNAIKVAKVLNDTPTFALTKIYLALAKIEGPTRLTQP